MDRRTFLKISAGAVGVIAVPPLFMPDTVGAGRRYLSHYAHSLMKISFHNPAGDRYAHQRVRMLMESMRKEDGLNPGFYPPNTPVNADMVVIWLWNMPELIADTQRRGRPILLMERGFIQPRDDFVSLAWNGLNGAGKYQPAPPEDKGKRFNYHFGKLLKPWKTDRSGYAVVMGQRPDLYTSNMNFDEWTQEMTDGLIARKYKVVYRPHPYIREQAKGDPGKMHTPRGAELSKGTLEQDLAGAAFTVVYSSNVCVESVLAGVPTVTMDTGAIAYDITSHSLDEPFFTPDRSKWCADMAWRQFTLKDLAGGKAWNHIKKAYNPVTEA